MIRICTLETLIFSKHTFRSSSVALKLKLRIIRRLLRFACPFISSKSEFVSDLFSVSLIENFASKDASIFTLGWNGRTLIICP